MNLTSTLGIDQIKQKICFFHHLIDRVVFEAQLSKKTIFMFVLNYSNYHIFRQHQMYAQVIHSATSSPASTLTFSLSPNYGYVLLVGILLAFQVLFIGFIFPGILRYQIFTEQFMREHFGQEHKSATGRDTEKGGYPDMGNGRYSDKLSYEQWYKFNNAQRVHQNFVEFAPSCFVMLFIAGIYFPIPAAVLGLVMFVARLVYSLGYVNNGPKGRLVGALSGDLMIAGLLALSLASGILMIQGRDSV